MRSGQDWLTSSMEMGRPGVLGWTLVVLRGGLLGALVFGGLVLLLAVRLVERPLCGLNRPVTPYITQGVCRAGLVLLGLRLQVRGAPMRDHGAMVANHASWLDIFVLNAVSRVYFVSKADVAGWPGIGWLARATGTLFITRKSTEAKEQQRLFEERLRAGHRLLFFPEGTSTDGIRILPFKSTLFAAFFTHGLDRVISVQPVTVIYRAPRGADLRFYGWWGEMGFGPHLVRVLAKARRGKVEVVLHPPVPVEDFADRKALTAHCERVIREGYPLGEGEGGSWGCQVRR